METPFEETADFLRARGVQGPEIGLITGTGLGGVIQNMALEARVPYAEIPHFPRATTPGHGGYLAFGRIGGRPVLAQEGRFHLYEGYSAQAITYPVRIMARLGVRFLLISSAAGGLNPLFEQGDLMLVTDHINLTGHNPLLGPNLEDFGPRFPDMSAVYCPDIRRIAAAKALELGMNLRQGVYAGVLGPSLETPAETRFLRAIGADAVGMSTVAEAITGVHCGLAVGAVVVITNMNLPDCMAETSLDAVIASAREAGPRLARLWEALIPALG